MSLWLDVLRVNKAADPTFINRLIKHMLGVPANEPVPFFGGKAWRDADLESRRLIEEAQRKRR